MSTEWLAARIAILKASLERHRDNIARLEVRRAKFGLNVPLELENELADEQKMAMEVEAQLQNLIAEGEDPLDRLFREATESRIMGQVGRALQLYRQIDCESEGTYPDIEMHIRETEQELGGIHIGPGGRVIQERVLSPPMSPRMPAPSRVPAGWLRLAGAAMALLCAVSAAVLSRSILLGPSVSTLTPVAGMATPTPRIATPTRTYTPTPSRIPFVVASDTPTSKPSRTPTPTPSRTPTLAVTLTPIPAVDFKIVKQGILPLVSAKCEMPEIHMYVLDKNGNPLNNILLEVYWEGGSKTFNSGWLGPGYEKATVSAGTFWVRVLGDVRPFGDRDYTSEVSRPLSTDQPTREDLDLAGYCQPSGECVECGLYSYEVVFQRQW